MLQNTKTFRKEDLDAGSIIFFKYYAKDYEATFDRTPLVLVLRTSKRYMLGLNLHWLPVFSRVWLVDKILERSKYSVKTRNKIDFKYSDFKPLMRSVKFAPCIRLYIKRRMSRRGVRVPIENFKTAAQLRTESFTRGKYTASELIRMSNMRTHWRLNKL